MFDNPQPFWKVLVVMNWLSTSAWKGCFIVIFCVDTSENQPRNGFLKQNKQIVERTLFVIVSAPYPAPQTPRRSQRIIFRSSATEL